MANSRNDPHRETDGEGEDLIDPSAVSTDFDREAARETASPKQPTSPGTVGPKRPYDGPINDSGETNATDLADNAAMQHNHITHKLSPLLVANTKIGNAPLNPELHPDADPEKDLVKIQLKSPGGVYSTLLVPKLMVGDYMRAGWSDYQQTDDPAVQHDLHDRKAAADAAHGRLLAEDAKREAVVVGDEDK